MVIGGDKLEEVQQLINLLIAKEQTIPINVTLGIGSSGNQSNIYYSQNPLLPREPPPAYDIKHWLNVDGTILIFKI